MALDAANRGDAPAPTRARNGRKPRILILAETLPYPTLKGGDHRNWQNVNILASFAEVGVFGLCSNDRRREIVPNVPLAFWTTATDPALAYPPPIGVSLKARAWLLDPEGHPSDLYFSEAARLEIETLVERFRPDVVVMEGLWLHGYLETVRRAGCAVLFDTHNVEAALMGEVARAENRPGLEGRVIRDVLPRRTEAIERKTMLGVDGIWVCSEVDECRVRELYDPPARVDVVPNGVNPADYERIPSDRRARSSELTLMYPGFFAHKPNAFAAGYLIDEIFPRLAALHGDPRLLLVGGAPTNGMLEAAERDPRIVVTGAVRDVRPYLARATAMAVPLFHGSGTRFKVLEAFAAGVPVIGTAKGAEGLDARHGEHLVIAESAVDFVESALAVWRDVTMVERLTSNAGNLLAERYSWNAIGTSIRKALNAPAFGV